jgi:hypothetical protein
MAVKASPAGLGRLAVADLTVPIRNHRRPLRPNWFCVNHSPILGNDLRGFERLNWGVLGYQTPAHRARMIQGYRRMSPAQKIEFEPLRVIAARLLCPGARLHNGFARRTR